MKEQTYYALSYFCFTPIKDPESLREAQHLYCVNKQLKGRIKVAPEGINGKISGRKEDCEAFINYLKQDTRFANISVNQDEHYGYVSEKMKSRTTREIVNAGLPEIKPYEKTGTFITPQEFEAMAEEGDVVNLDVRSDYETAVGKFKNSIVLPIKNFREFPNHLSKLEKYKNKRIVVWCTSGIKDEKATAYLLSKGFEKVYQVRGGIVGYGKETDGSAFEGVCYVFDNRLTVPINKKNPTTISQCHVCHTPSHRMVNCANMVCNRHVPICHPCAEKIEGACSIECQKAPTKRAYNGTGYYVKESNGYNPHKGIKSKERVQR
ncbi:MAG: rhodanese-related sulfurtransferase [Bacteroidota bacterium]